MANKCFIVSYTDPENGLSYEDLAVLPHFLITQQPDGVSVLGFRVYSSKGFMVNNLNKPIRHMSRIKVAVSPADYVTYWAIPFSEDVQNSTPRNPLEYAFDFMTAKVKGPNGANSSEYNSFPFDLTQAQVETFVLPS